MKALSLTQPWADVILEQGKRVENREKWAGCSYRGPILLHAAKGIGSRAELSDRLAMVRTAGVPEAWISERFESHWLRASEGTRFWKPRPSLHRGGIVGRADIVGTFDVHSSGAWASWMRDADQRKWWFGGFALVLDKVEALPFVPWKGALGLFEVPDDYASRAA